eukprot:4768602-Alexandrium_andersonii.AAC.1
MRSQPLHVAGRNGRARATVYSHGHDLANSNTALRGVGHRKGGQMIGNSHSFLASGPHDSG